MDPICTLLWMSFALGLYGPVLLVWGLRTGRYWLAAGGGERLLGGFLLLLAWLYSLLTAYLALG